MQPILTLQELETVVDVDDVDLGELVTCASCGTVTAPDGVCVELGTCERADRLATRGATRRTAKTTAAPAAWGASGNVD